jgi:hypothetical protein
MRYCSEFQIFRSPGLSMGSGISASGLRIRRSASCRAGTIEMVFKLKEDNLRFNLLSLKPLDHRR